MTKLPDWAAAEAPAKLNRTATKGKRESLRKRLCIITVGLDTETRKGLRGDGFQWTVAASAFFDSHRSSRMRSMDRSQKLAQRQTGIPGLKIETLGHPDSGFGCEVWAVVLIPDPCSSGFGGCEALVDFVPVDDAPPGGQIVGAAVLVFQVVGVLPDVVAEDGIQALGQRRFLVGGGDDLELAAGEDEPTPAGTELLGGGFIEGLLEGFKVAEIGRDLCGDGTGGRAAYTVRANGAHQLPEGRVVGVAPAVIADGSLNVIGHRGEVANQVINRFGGQVGVVGQGGI